MTESHTLVSVHFNASLRVTRSVSPVIHAPCVQDHSADVLVVSVFMSNQTTASEIRNGSCISLHVRACGTVLAVPCQIAVLGATPTQHLDRSENSLADHASTSSTFPTKSFYTTRPSSAK